MKKADDYRRLAGELAVDIVQDFEDWHSRFMTALSAIAEGVGE
jgi:hypothetical protein